MLIFVTILQLLAALILIAIVLFQSGKESGLSGAISGSAETYLSKNKKGGLDQALATATKWVALAWVLLTLALSLM